MLSQIEVKLGYIELDCGQNGQRQRPPRGDLRSTPVKESAKGRQGAIKGRQRAPEAAKPHRQAKVNEPSNIVLNLEKTNERREKG